MKCKHSQTQYENQSCDIWGDIVVGDNVHPEATEDNTGRGLVNEKVVCATLVCAI